MALIRQVSALVAVLMVCSIAVCTAEAATLVRTATQRRFQGQWRAGPPGSQPGRLSARHDEEVGLASRGRNRIQEEEELEILGKTDQRHLQAELIKRANQAVKSLMLLLARLPSAARVDDFPRLAAFVRSFEEQPKAAKSQAMQGDTRLQHLPFHLARGMSRM